MKLREFLQEKWLSRRSITSLIDEGNISLNWTKVESYWAEIKEWDEVVCEDKSWRCEAMPEQKDSHLLAFYKPIAYVCSKSDPHNDTIYKILPEEYHSWYYIWRLDRDSRGLVLLTNDPKMVDQYEHPRHGITKEYLVTLNKNFHKEDIDRCLNGIDDKEELLKAIEIQILDDVLYENYKKYLLPEVVKSSACVIRMVLNEWKKRHIRRMMSAMRYHVEDLVRISEGKFALGNLQEWEFKIVSVVSAKC